MACALTGLAFSAHAASDPAGIATPPLPRAGLPVVQASEQAPVLLAQVASPEMIQLEEQVRSLNGKVEELTFQLLQLQEQLRKMQEDSDFRFQQLEEQRGDAGPAAGSQETQVATAAPADAGQPAELLDRLDLPPRPRQRLSLREVVARSARRRRRRGGPRAASATR